MGPVTGRNLTDLKLHSLLEKQRPLSGETVLRGPEGAERCPGAGSECLEGKPVAITDDKYWFPTVAHIRRAGLRSAVTNLFRKRKYMLGDSR